MATLLLEAVEVREAALYCSHHKGLNRWEGYRMGAGLERDREYGGAINRDDEETYVSAIHRLNFVIFPKQSGVKC